MATYAEIKSEVDGFLGSCTSMGDVLGGFDTLIASVGALVEDVDAAEHELHAWLSDHQYLGFP